MEEKKKTTNMSDFANLFLAIYSSKKTMNEGKLYISKYFNDIFEDVITDYNLIIPGLLDETCLFNTSEFKAKIEHSNIKKNWADELKYDLQRDQIYTQIKEESVRKEIKEYEDEDIDLVDKIAEEVIRKEKEYEENEELVTDNQNRKYILI